MRGGLLVSAAVLLRLDEEQGDVVVAGGDPLGVVDEGVGEGVEGLVPGLCELVGEVGGGVIDVDAGGFDESIGVQGEHSSGR